MNQQYFIEYIYLHLTSKNTIVCGFVWVIEYFKIISATEYSPSTWTIWSGENFENSATGSSNRKLKPVKTTKNSSKTNPSTKSLKNSQNQNYFVYFIFLSRSLITLIYDSQSFFSPNTQPNFLRVLVKFLHFPQDNILIFPSSDLHLNCNLTILSKTKLNKTTKKLLVPPHAI